MNDCFLPGDIDDMKICYVLLDGSNATSDIFYFTVEDNGKTIFSTPPIKLIKAIINASIKIKSIQLLINFCWKFWSGFCISQEKALFLIQIIELGRKGKH